MFIDLFKIKPGYIIFKSFILKQLRYFMMNTNWFHTTAKWLKFIICMTFVLMKYHDGNCQIDRLQLQTKLDQLEKIVRQESGNENFFIAEQAMNQAVKLMGELGYPTEEQSKRIQQRIQFSIKAKRFFSAYEAASAWLVQHPDDTSVTNLLATAAIYMNRNREAREALRNVYESAPDNESYQERYLNVLRTLNDRADCTALCNKIISNPNGSSKLKLAAVNALTDMDMDHEALTAAESLEPFEGKSSLTAFLNAKIHFKENAIEKALYHFQKVEPNHPRYTQAQTQTAICYARLRRFEEAARQNLEILGRNPYDQNAYINLAQALARLRKPEASKIVVSIQKQVERNEMPLKEGDYYWSKGDMVEFGRLQAIGMNLKHQFRNAEQLLTAVSESVPESIQAKINLGKHYFTTLQASKAEKLFQQLLTSPEGYDQSNIKLLLAEAFLRQDKPDEALKTASQVDDKNKDSVNALLGTYYLEMKHQPEAALTYLEQITDATNSMVAAKSKCLMLLKQPNEALSLFKQLPENEITPEQSLIKADCLIQLGKINEAEQLIVQVQKNHPELSLFLMIPVHAALIKAKNDPSQSGWEEKVEKVKRTQQEIQSKVVEAQRKGLPDSIPILVKLSTLCEEAGDRPNALLYARRAYDAEPNNTDHLIRLIKLMTDKEHVIERYHLIQKAKQVNGIQDNFQNELDEVYEILGLN